MTPGPGRWVGDLSEDSVLVSNKIGTSWNPFKKPTTTTTTTLPADYSSQLASAMAIKAYNDAEAKDTATRVSIHQVSNGYTIVVMQRGQRLDRIVTDYAEIGNEIMAALAELQLGK
jgi:hypothetical protein